jgi:hypothetical protein
LPENEKRVGLISHILNGQVRVFHNIELIKTIDSFNTFIIKREYMADTVLDSGNKVSNKTKNDPISTNFMVYSGKKHFDQTVTQFIFTNGASCNESILSNGV